MPYDLKDLEQLRQFDNDCCEAKRQCPQQQNCEPVIPTYKTTSLAFVFQWWFNDDTLWKRGYHEYLSTKAQETFERYTILKYGVVIDVFTREKFEPRK